MVVGFVGVAIALHVIGRVLVTAVRPLAASRLFALRHAVLNLTRPGNQTRVVLLAVGLGSFFIIGVRAIQTNLLAGFALELREDMPDMFLIDIQQDQADGVRALLEGAGAGSRGGAAQLIPVLRARVTGVQGEETSIEGRREVRRAGFGREYTITYRPRLEDNERVIAGKFWDGEPSAVPEVSIEESLQERGIDLGDRVRFDVLGREIEARVTSVRNVEWDDSRSGGFMFLFRPGDVRRRSAHVHRLLAGSGPGGGAGAAAARYRGAVRQRLRHRRPRGDRDRPARARLCHACHHRRRRNRAAGRRADSRRFRGDDEVPADVRGRGLQNPRRQLARPGGHVRAGSTACWERWRGWSAPSARWA